MALINCPECGKEISSNAKNCPNCGNPMNVKQNNKENNSIASTTFIIAFVCMLISFFINPFGLLGIIAIICSIISIVNTKKSASLIVFNVFILIASIGISFFYIKNIVEVVNKANSALSNYK